MGFHHLQVARFQRQETGIAVNNLSAQSGSLKIAPAVFPGNVANIRVSTPLKPKGFKRFVQIKIPGVAIEFQSGLQDIIAKARYTLTDDWVVAILISRSLDHPHERRFGDVIIPARPGLVHTDQLTPEARLSRRVIVRAKVRPCLRKCRGLRFPHDRNSFNEKNRTLFDWFVRLLIHRRADSNCSGIMRRSNDTDSPPDVFEDGNLKRMIRHADINVRHFSTLESSSYEAP